MYSIPIFWVLSDFKKVNDKLKGFWTQWLRDLKNYNIWRTREIMNGGASKRKGLGHGTWAQ